MEDFKRLFIGIPIPLRLQSYLYQDFDYLHQDMHIRWIPKENYHITLQFLGNTNPDKIKGIEAKLSELLSGIHKFHLVFTQYVFFPHRKPYMIWFKAEESPTFDALQKKIQLSFSTQQQVQKPAIPHITLARFKNPKIAKRIELPNLKEATTLKVDSVVLWESILKPISASYQKINTIHLA